MAVKLKVTKDITRRVIASMKALTEDRVLVGIPANRAERTPEEGEAKTLNNAELGYIQERGAPEANIPARPFLAPAIEDARDKIVERYQAAAKKALDGDNAAVAAAHEAVGTEAANSVRRKITEGPFAPLKASTLANRRRKGRTGENPLIDTGKLRDAVDYVVRPAK